MNGGSADDVRRAIRWVREAAAATDPSLAAAWAKQAEARHLLVMMGQAAPADAYPPARQAADRALAAGPSLADAHFAQGLVQLWFDWRPADAARSFERALALNASSAAAHHDYAWALVALGRGDEAIAHITDGARSGSAVGARAQRHRLALSAAAAAGGCRSRVSAHSGDPARRSRSAGVPRARLRATRAVQRGAAGGARRHAGISGGRAGEQRADDCRGVTGRLALAGWSGCRQASRTRWISPFTLAVQRALLGDRAQALKRYSGKRVVSVSACWCSSNATRRSMRSATIRRSPPCSPRLPQRGDDLVVEG